MRHLRVWLGTILVGELAQDEAGRLRFQYDPIYLATPDAWPISVSLPTTEATFEERARPVSFGPK